MCPDPQSTEHGSDMMSSKFPDIIHAVFPVLLTMDDPFRNQCRISCMKQNHD